MPWLWGLPPNDRRYYPLYAECIELLPGDCLAEVDGLGLDAESRAAFLGANASKVFRLGA